MDIDELKVRECNNPYPQRGAHRACGDGLLSCRQETGLLPRGRNRRQAATPRCSRPLSRAKIDTERPELRGARLLRRSAEDIGPPGDLERLESRRNHRCLELCFQQSAGDSTGPEIDVAPRAFGHRLLHHDIADIELPSRLEICN